MFSTGREQISPFSGLNHRDLYDYAPKKGETRLRSSLQVEDRRWRNLFIFKQQEVDVCFVEIRCVAGTCCLGCSQRYAVKRSPFYAHLPKNLNNSADSQDKLRPFQGRDRGVCVCREMWLYCGCRDSNRTFVAGVQVFLEKRALRYVFIW